MCAIESGPPGPKIRPARILTSPEVGFARRHAQRTRLDESFPTIPWFAPNGLQSAPARPNLPHSCPPPLGAHSPPPPARPPARLGLARAITVRWGGNRAGFKKLLRQIAPCRRARVALVGQAARRRLQKVPARLRGEWAGRESAGRPARDSQPRGRSGRARRTGAGIAPSIWGPIHAFERQSPSHGRPGRAPRERPSQPSPLLGAQAATGRETAHGPPGRYNTAVNRFGSPRRPALAARRALRQRSYDR